MTDPLPTRYDFRAVEDRIFPLWEEAGAFRGRREEGRAPYCVVIPPPNVTGVLHIGHVLDNTPQDINVRFRRMQGYGVVWIPGTDHAGIATQNVVKRALDAEGVDYRALGREEFVRRVWQWREEKGRTIIRQLRRLGCSCDFARERFTMDEGLSRAVGEAFARLYARGLIVRGRYLTNWCVTCRTVLSDDEVEHEPVDGRFWYLRYPLADGPGDIVVATTRPETMLGDTAVAVHPDPEGDLRRRLGEARRTAETAPEAAARAAAAAEAEALERRLAEHLPRLLEVAGWVGRRVRLPLCDREIPIIADPSVKTDFGTGQLKVTPGHDPTDYQIGRRHGLPLLTVIGLDGRITDAAPAPYRGLDRAAARRAVLDDLAAGGFLDREEPREQMVGHCYRCHDVVEPLETDQWFVRMRPLAERAAAAVREGRVRIIPPKFEANYFRWLDEVRDWCISRQLWWGHRLPIWYPKNADGSADTARPVCSAAAPAPGAIPGVAEYVQDPDVLDTWFSSALWPFSTLGWPDDTADLAYWYPNAWLNSGKDILFFWDARMIMLGLELMGEVPFRELYLHGIARDAENRKISKSLNNSPDVLAMLDERGADALRLGIIAKSPAGEDVQLKPEVYDYGRNFCTKLWNAARLVLMALGAGPGQGTRGKGQGQASGFGLRASEGADGTPPLKPEAWSRKPEGAPHSVLRTPHLEDRWMTSRLHRAARRITALLEQSAFSQATEELHAVFWGDFCDWYLEFVKDRLSAEDGAARARAAAAAAGLLVRLLKLAHPFIPFLTEDLFQRLRARGATDENDGALLMTAPWFSGDEGAVDAALEARVALLQTLIAGVRNVRAQMNLSSRTPLVLAVAPAEGTAPLADEEARLLALPQMARLERVAAHTGAPPRPAATLTAEGVQAWVPLAGLIDVAAERARLEKNLAALEQRARAAEAKLANDRFRTGAPADVVAGVERQLADSRAQAAALRRARDDLA